VYIGATEVEISDFEYEKKVILRKRALKIYILKFHTFLHENIANKQNNWPSYCL